MSARYILLLPAIFVDGLTALFGIALAGVGVTVSAVFGAIPVLGPLVATAASSKFIPIGIVLGFIVAFVFNVVFGSGIVTMLLFNDIFYPQYLIPSFFGEIVPGASYLPFWTALVWFSIRRKNREEKEAQ